MRLVEVELEWCTINELLVTSVEGTYAEAEDCAIEVCGNIKMAVFAPHVRAVTVVEVAPVDDSVTVPVAFERPSINCWITLLMRGWFVSVVANHKTPLLVIASLPA